jgi:hypothetical protein
MAVSFVYMRLLFVCSISFTGDDYTFKGQLPSQQKKKSATKQMFEMLLGRGKSNHYRRNEKKRAAVNAKEQTVEEVRRNCLMAHT